MKAKYHHWGEKESNSNGSLGLVKILIDLKTKEKASKEGLCFGCAHPHQWKDCPLNKDCSTTNIVIAECDVEMQESPRVEHMLMQLSGYILRG